MSHATAPYGPEPAPDGARRGPVPLGGTRVRLRDTAFLSAVVLVCGAILLGLGLLGGLAFTDAPAGVRLALAVGPLMVLAPVAAGAVGYLCLMRRGPRLTRRDLGLVRPNRIPVGLLLWVPLAILTSALATGAAFAVSSALNGGGGNDGTGLSASSDLVTSLPPSAGVLVALGSVLLVPLLEEVIFRGMLHGALSRHVAPWAAVALSAAAFSLVHVSPLLMPYTLVLGLWLGWLHRRYESLVPAIVLHCCNNGLVLAVALSAV